MRSWVLAASLLAVAPAAWAADVDEEGPPPPKSGIYDYYKAPKAPPRPYGGPPPFFNDRDDDNGYEGPPPPAKKYSGAPPPYAGNCMRGEAVRDQLTSRGWQDFHGGQQQGELVTLRARRPNGRLFELTMHRCTGQLVEAQPLEPRRLNLFAYKAPYGQYDDDRRWWRGRYGHDRYSHGRHSYDRSWSDRPYAYYRGSRRWNWDD